MLSTAWERSSLQDVALTMRGSMDTHLTMRVKNRSQKRHSKKKGCNGLRGDVKEPRKKRMQRVALQESGKIPVRKDIKKKRMHMQRVGRGGCVHVGRGMHRAGRGIANELRSHSIGTRPTFYSHPINALQGQSSFLNSNLGWLSLIHCGVPGILLPQITRTEPEWREFPKWKFRKGWRIEGPKIGWSTRKTG